MFLRLTKIEVQRVTVVKFGVDSRVSDGTHCLRLGDTAMCDRLRDVNVNITSSQAMN